ncbi:FixH family protein [Antarcticibacterium sp. 1MA-6-2]|uniref:FixH family protein n=1 Tax=Antarcticibacterium sp. 1MA-6-2 TaxID=2908210 RepID=UPI001F174C0C|nr:FixH family protein [Antarcticibacterium sp. 1MA-6-2]UJH90840.1 FixH family protein [Antarcticibacterium sp. 1MA-6-2]
MKISWGTAIVLAIISFMTFILYLVISMTTDKNFNHDLVTEEYYKQELSFQGKLDRETNSLNLLSNIKASVENEGVVIYFPENLNYEDVKGSIFLYRPSDKELDFTIPIELTAHQVLIPAKFLKEGRWNIEIDWSYLGESYYFKKEFTY